MEKGTFVNQITEEGPVGGVFLVKTMNLANTKTGKPFLSLTLMDKTGEIPAKIWDNALTLKDACTPDNFIAIAGQAQLYRNAMQLTINRLSATNKEKVDMADFLPTTTADVNALWEELLKSIESIEDQELRTLLTNVFNETGFADHFKRSPAAKHMHHAYLGGLLEHTVAITRLAEKVCCLYPDINKDLLLAGVILHDIGKMDEFSKESLSFDYSTQGRLEGHLVMGAELVSRHAADIPGFSPEKISLLKHLILSHHGRLEFGSPVLPMTIEALVLNLLDDLDAKVNYFHRLGSQAGEAYQWSEYQRPLERFLLIKKPLSDNYAVTCSTETPNQINDQGKKDKHEDTPPRSMQPTLF